MALGITAFLLIGHLAWAAVAVALVGGFASDINRGAKYLRRLPSVELEPVGPEVALPGAEAWVAEFEAAGFRRVGGYRGQLPIGVRDEQTDIVTVLVAPTGDRVASPNEVVVEVCSWFSGRVLMTVNRAASPERAEVHTPGGWARRRPTPRRARGGAPAVGGAGDHSRSRAGGRRCGALIELEYDLMRFLSANPVRNNIRIGLRRPAAEGALGHDGRSRGHIDAWLDAAAAQRPPTRWPG